MAGGRPKGFEGGDGKEAVLVLGGFALPPAGSAFPADCRGAALSAALVAAALAALAWGVVALLNAGAGPAPVSADAIEHRAERAYAQLPLRFEPNRGQTDPRVRFLSRGDGYSMFLTRRGAVLALGSGSTAATVRIRPVGANPGMTVDAGRRLHGHSNYLSGSDPNKWVTGVPGYGRVRYDGVYPGVDLIFRGNRQKLEYDFVVAAGADPRRIELAMTGARRLALDARGDLVAHTSAGKVRQKRPFIYQHVGGAKRQVQGHYVLKGRDRVGFALGGYDPKRPLVIDPVLAYYAELGVDGGESPGPDPPEEFLGDANAVAVADGCVAHCDAYITGATTSLEFPTANAAQPEFGGRTDFERPNDAFVTKLDASGSMLEYSTYLGGNDHDTGFDIAVDSSGSAHLTGETSSGGATPNECAAQVCREFPTKNPVQGYGGGFYDAFVTKLDPSGGLAYSTFLGGFSPRDRLDDESGGDHGYGIALKPGCAPPCEAYVTGETSSLNFPVKDAAQGSIVPSTDPNTPSIDAFVTKLNSAGSGVAYSTYLGGTGVEMGMGIAADAPGNAYVTGETQSSDFPKQNAYQSDRRGSQDAFVTKLDTTKSGAGSLSYSTLLGGAETDGGTGIAVDGSGDVYVAGYTASPDLPRKKPNQNSLRGSEDAFVSKLDPDTAGDASLSYSTFLGGGDNSAEEGAVEGATDVAVDASGGATVIGHTESKTFPTKQPYQRALRGPKDAFVTKLDPVGSTILNSTYFGGGTGEKAGEIGQGIALDRSGSVYLTGSGSSPADFPGAHRFGKLGGAFVAKLSPAADFSLTVTSAPESVYAGEEISYTLTAQNVGPEKTGATLRDALPDGVELVSAAGCFIAQRVLTCPLNALPSGGSAQRQIVVRPTRANPTLTNTVSVQSWGVDSKAANDTASAVTEVRQPPETGSTGSGTGSGPPGSGHRGPVDTLFPALRAQAGRAEAMRRCLALVRRHRRREGASARRGSLLRRVLARRHMVRHARRGDRRCRRRHGRVPGQVTGLGVRALSSTSAVLSFRAPGTDGSQPPAARAYLIKLARGEITSARRFRRAQSLCRGSCSFDVTEIGTRISLRVDDLRPRTTYHFAVAARDNVSRRLGPRSQTVKVKTN